MYIKHNNAYRFHVDLFGAKKPKEASSRSLCITEKRKILLGQALYFGADVHKNIELAHEIIARYGIDYYLPHPKESYKLTDVEYIETSLICEEYVIKYLQEHPNHELHIYTYCSSCAVNLQGILRLKIISLRPKMVPSFLCETYDLFDRVGIEIINL